MEVVGIVVCVGFIVSRVGVDVMCVGSCVCVGAVFMFVFAFVLNIYLCYMERDVGCCRGW